MKIIDLLVKISKGEEVPKKIKFNDAYYIFNTPFDDYESLYGASWLLKEHNDNLKTFLNDEVEIIEEEKETRKLPNEIQQPRNFEEVVYIAEDLVRKINEIIDVINDMRDKE